MVCCLTQETEAMDYFDRTPPQMKKWMPLAFIIVGSAISMPGISFTAPRAYFLYKLRTIQADNGTAGLTTTAMNPHVTSTGQVFGESGLTHANHSGHDALNNMQQRYESMVVIVINAAIFTFNILSVLIASHVKLSTRILGSLVMVFLLIIPAIALAMVNTDKFQEAFFGITMATVFLVVGFSTLAFSSFISFSATIGQSMLQVTMISVATGAVAVALLNIFSLLVHVNVALTAIIYFASTAFLLLIAILVAWYMLRTESIQWYASRLHSGSQSETNNGKGIRHIWETFLNSWIFHLNHYLAFFCTGVVFPATATAIASVHYVKGDIWFDTLFMPVAIFLNYYIMIFVGRFLPRFFRLPPFKYYKWILLITTIRFGFIPIFVFCNVQPRSPEVPVVFDMDVYPIIFTSLLGVIHGYFQVIVVQYAATHVKTDQKEHVTMIGLAFTAIGQICGAVVSIPIIDAITP